MKLDEVHIYNLSVVKIKNTQPIMEVIKIAPRNYHTLSFKLSGENIMECNGEDMLLYNGIITYIPLGTPFSFRIIDVAETILISFNTTENIGESAKIFQSNKQLETLFKMIFATWELKQKTDNLQCMAIFYNILSILDEQYLASSHNRNSYLLDPAITYMHTHFKENDFKISTLYEVANIAPTYFRRLFMKMYGITPVQYLKQLRIDYSKQLLSLGFHSVTEIAEISGFSSVTYFCTEFKKETGYTPLQYIMDAKNQSKI